MKCSTVSSVVRRDFAVRHCFLPISASSSPRMIEIQTFSKPLSWLTPGIGLITIRRVSRMPTCSVDFFVKLYVRFSIASIAFEVTGLRRPPARTSVCTKRKSSHFSSAEEWLTLFLVFEDRRAPPRQKRRASSRGTASCFKGRLFSLCNKNVTASREASRTQWTNKFLEGKFVGIPRYNSFSGCFFQPALRSTLSSVSPVGLLLSVFPVFSCCCARTDLITDSLAQSRSAGAHIGSGACNRTRDRAGKRSARHRRSRGGKNC